MYDPRSLAHPVLDLVGETPLPELHRCVGPRRFCGRLLVKLELLDPAGSNKDRAALEIIRRAKADGPLADGQAVVELTSGNIGAGLAIVCRARGSLDLGQPGGGLATSRRTRVRRHDRLPRV